MGKEQTKIQQSLPKKGPFPDAQRKAKGLFYAFICLFRPRGIALCYEDRLRDSQGSKARP